MSDNMYILTGIGIFIMFILIISAVGNMVERYCEMRERISKNEIEKDDDGTYIMK